MPTARADGVSAVVGGRVFVIGGTNREVPNNGYSRLWANEGFRAADGVWEVRAPMPTARGHMAGDTLGGVIYVVGGSTVVEVYDTLEVYDPNWDAWTVGPSMPTTRWNVAGASVGDKLYVAGGEVSRMVATDALEVFDPSTQTWSARPAMPTARFKAGSAVLGGRLVVVGAETAVGVSNRGDAFIP
jgi:N-acetylneuraminic acid mutarotase